MDNNDAQFNRRLALLVLLSFVVFAFAVALRVGIGATPYETTDNAGRRMGFNDPLHAEHYVIMLRNFSPTELLKLEYAYEWILFAAHVLGAGILFASNRVSYRVCRRFYFAQAILFPVGILALPLFPLLVVSFLTGLMDREGFVDGPFILAIAHPVWVTTSLIIAFGLRGADLGMFRVRGAVTQANRAGSRTFPQETR